MNIAAPNLSPLFRSDVQAEILARLFLSDGRWPITTADLARSTNSAYATAHREVQRLIDAGLVTEVLAGRSKLLAANVDHRAYAPLVELLSISYGPQVIISRILSEVPEIEQAFIYGSWAARRAGERGSAPRDIDVIVVGNASRAALSDAAQRAESALGLDVNIRVVTSETWQKGDDPFLRTITARPLVELERQGP